MNTIHIFDAVLLTLLNIIKCLLFFSSFDNYYILLMKSVQLLTQMITQQIIAGGSLFVLSVRQRAENQQVHVCSWPQR